MTKEEIIEQNPVLIQLIGNHGVGAFQLIGRIMEEYAKIKSTQFAQWLNDSNWGEAQTWGRHDPPSYPTNDQLYDIFNKETNCKPIEQQNKDNG